MLVHSFTRDLPSTGAEERSMWVNAAAFESQCIESKKIDKMANRYINTATHKTLSKVYKILLTGLIEKPQIVYVSFVLLTNIMRFVAKRMNLILLPRQPFIVAFICRGSATNVRERQLKTIAWLPRISGICRTNFGGFFGLIIFISICVTCWKFENYCSKLVFIA